MLTPEKPSLAAPRRRQALAAAGAALAGWPTSHLLAQSSEPWPEVSGALAQARLAGQTRLRVWGFEVYDAQLWVGAGFRASQFTQHPLALSLIYLRALKGTAIADRSLKEMRGLQAITEGQADQWLSAMRQTFPDVQATDRLTGLHQPGVGARFWLNGQARGNIGDADFSALFFGIWLHEASSEPGLRRELLAGATP